METIKDNQMRICFLSRVELNRLWEKMMPSDRIITDLPTLCVYYRQLNTLFIAGTQEDFLAEKEDILAPKILASISVKDII